MTQDYITYEKWLQALHEPLHQVYEVARAGCADFPMFGYLDRKDLQEQHTHARNHLIRKETAVTETNHNSVDPDTGLRDTAHCAWRCLMELHMVATMDLENEIIRNGFIEEVQE